MRIPRDSFFVFPTPSILYTLLGRIGAALVGGVVDGIALAVEIEVLEYAADMEVPNIEIQLVKIDIEEQEEVDDVGVVENAKKGLLHSGLQSLCSMPNNFMVQDLKKNRKAQEKF